MAKKEQSAATRASRRYEEKVFAAGGERLTVLLRPETAQKLAAIRAGRTKAATLADLIARA